MRKILLLFTVLQSLILVPLQCMAEGGPKAQWITSSTHPWMDGMPARDGTALPVMRGEFQLQKCPRQALLNATALGVYDVYINGQRVGDEELKPGWTDYRKEVMLQQTEVSHLLRRGLNVVEVQLSRGWWAGGIARGVYGKRPPMALLAWIEADGQILVATDSTWRCSHTGPLLQGDIYKGETYDARRTPADWQPVSITTEPTATPIPQEGPVVKIRNKRLWRSPETVTIYHDTLATGTRFGSIKVDRKVGAKPFILRRGEKAVVDLGQNMVGWMWFDVKGTAGTTLTLRHGEMLNDTGDHEGRLDDGPAGSLWRYNLRKADATVRYTLRGDKKGEQYHPSHTFMGFRYVELSATEDIEIRKLRGQVVGSDIDEWGSFECNNKSVNQLYSNIWWGQRGNFLSIPTDCPQRDERLGWTGDTQIFARTALYNSNATAFYRKWMRDMRNSQRADGAYPDIAPYNNFWGYGTAAWGDAGVIVPWTVYQMTGDREILEENYGCNRRWMDYLATQQEQQGDTLWRHIGGGTATGDWLAYDPLDARYVAMSYYAYVAQLMDSMAHTLGHEADALHYRRLYGDIREEFQRRYIDRDGHLRQTTQTAWLLALRIGLLPESMQEAACDSLRGKITQNGYRLSTGFVGTGILCTTLSELGMDDLAYALLLQRENPSWLYSVDQGATTVWERWDSYTRDRGFHRHPWNMNSFNHYAYGAVAEWLYAYVGGIQPATPGFGRLRLSPHADRRPDDHPTLQWQPRITWARAKTHTPQGDVETYWRRAADGHFEYTFRIPRGVPYVIDIPGLTKEDKVIVK